MSIDVVTRPGRGFLSRRAGALAVGALAVGLVAAGAPAASAHDRLASSDPASGAVLEAVPEEVVLTFSSPVQSLGTVVELQDDAGETAGDAVASVEGSEVVLEVSAGLEDGDYALVYRVTSSDGHPISGEVPFTLEAAAAPATESPSPPTTGAGPAASAAPSPSAASVGTAPSAAAGSGAEGDAASAASSSENTSVPWTPVVVVLVVIALGVLAAAALGRRPRESADTR